MEKPRWKKTVLREGKWWPTGATEPIVFTPQAIAHHEKRANELLESHFPLAGFWEHQQQDTSKLSLNDILEQKAKGTFGRPDKFYREGKDLVAEGYAHDEAEMKLLEKCEFVSPALDKDVRNTATGEVWPGWSITSLAATPQPVQVPQDAFARLSRICFSLNHYQLSDTKPEDKPKENPPSGSGYFKEIVADLKKCKIVLPDDTNEQNFAERLRPALKTYLETMGLSQETDNMSTNNNGQADNPTGLMFSQMETRVKALEEKNKSLETDNQTKDAYIANLQKDDLKRRAGILLSTGRVTKPIHESLTKELETVKLSLGADGKAVAVGVLAKIEAYEALPEGHVFPVNGSTHLSRLKPAEPPSDDPEARREEILKAAREAGKSVSRV